MPHFRSYFDSPFLGAWDLEDLERDAYAIIESVKGEKVKNPQGEEDAKLVVTFSTTSPPLPDKPLLCNVTNAKAIAAIYGNDTDRWIGQAIAMYVAEVDAFGVITPCIRVRPRPPKLRRQEVPQPQWDEAAPSPSSAQPAQLPDAIPMPPAPPTPPSPAYAANPNEEPAR